MTHWTIRQRFIALLLGIITLFGALTVFLLARQATTTGHLQSLYERDYRVASLLGQLDGLLTRVDINILRMIAIGDPASIASWKQQNSERFGQAEQRLAELKAAADPSLLGLIGTLEEAYGRMRRGMENQVLAIEAGDVARGGEINRTQVKDNADQTFGALSELKKQQDVLTAREVETQLAAAATTRQLSVAVSLLVAGGSVLLGLMLVGSVVRSLRQAIQAAERMAAGDLSGALRVDGRDEPAQVLQALSRMQDSLAGIVQGVRGNADNVASASAQIAQSSQDLSGRTEQQASALQQTASSMDQLASTVRRNADNAQQANQLALGASTVAVQGGEVVEQVVHTMKDINDSSRRIADIIGVIDGIAFQTNILALNAAVEAARAGEQGRGFAVVAGEVRSLAGRSADAAKEIKSLISASVDRVDQGTSLVGRAGATMNEVVASIRRVTDLMGEISSASVEQSAGVAQVGEAVTHMDRATQQNAAVVEQNVAASDTLRQQAQHLVQAVSVFKLA